MTEEFIEFPTDSRQWLLRAFYSAMLFVVAIKVANTTIAIAAIVVLNAIMLAKPVTALINTQSKTLKYVYRKPYSFRCQSEIDLSKYSRIYTQVESYAGRSLHLSGPKGEHLILAKFNQSPTSPNQHIKEVTTLRKAIASALKIHDGGDV
ncbi:hypothetical protein [Pseudomonas tumuqii]|uniref:hypothetical protein n=1 Tax=Pseudomonas tumuqii TaxID=2715755 RepID=UPI0015525203|nr:hypothetical protein [Pseudomonas tumuqii]